MDSQPETDFYGDIPLWLVDASKATEMSPNGLAIGHIKLRSWQIHHLPAPSDLAGSAVYLVRLTYDFDVAPDVPPPLWAEVGFEFHLNGCIVRDALPRVVTAPAGYESYQLSEQLYFTPRTTHDVGHWPAGSPAANVPLPPLRPELSCSGIGGTEVRWSHTGGVPTGSHTAYLVLELPERCAKVPVIASGRYEIPLDRAQRLLPASMSSPFEVRLPVPGSNGAPSAPAPVSDDGSALRVFVSHAPESEEHEGVVRELCGFLAKRGMVVHFDRRHLQSSPDWDKWITAQIMRADVVLVVVSPYYLAAAAGDLPEGDQLGVAIDHRRLTGLLHRHPEIWTKKILAVELPGSPPNALPGDFLPGVGKHLTIEGFTPEGMEELLEQLEDRPGRGLGR
ncbi:toll/interleukin-1 receptor domain-containing protein [Amycolatopsis sp. CA-126428]|uniref:toll/interleukin-1 receptor domain-containing protein n=1 Tax=Amycolatopsis sp. CA-126428 TaxID=2073158 RepID=UPI000CD23968|nr:toll/interleukin-1 receptor domain-containing protein [Amycolatopsis sp. CA-126428]